MSLQSDQAKHVFFPWTAQSAAQPLENVGGSGGARFQTADRATWWDLASMTWNGRRIRKLCDRHGIVLISDEVLSGFGRTGRWFAVDREGVVPDMIPCAKGLTAGYAPGGAVLVHEKVARYFDDHTLLCGLTSYAHPLTCAAIVAATEAYEEEGLLGRASQLGEALEARWSEFGAKRPFVGETRGAGLLWAIELVVPGTREAASAARMSRVAEALRRSHLFMHKRDNLLYFAPPLVISEAEIGLALGALGAALDETFA